MLASPRASASRRSLSEATLSWAVQPVAGRCIVDKDIFASELVIRAEREGVRRAAYGIIEGKVLRVDPISQNGTVTVEVALEGELPKGARADLSVDGVIELERLDNVLYVGRPAYGQPEQAIGLFRIEPDGKSATRISVKLGRASVSTIEVLQGLQTRDSVIISDMSRFDNVNRVRIER